jgi:PIN domain nuclease of toxin-antitoxin system
VIVFDSSALLCYAKKERGVDQVKPVVDTALINTVNWAEVLQKILHFGINISEFSNEMALIGLTIIPFLAEDAELAAQLYDACKPYGLSLADRCCLATATRLNATVMTTDQDWSKVGLPLDIIQLR